MAMTFPSSSTRWVLRKHRCVLTDMALEAWAGTKNLGAETFALTTTLSYVQAMLNTTRGIEIDNPELDFLLLKLRLLAHKADTVLDELEHFRHIQDDLADVHAGGCVHGLLLRARHAARALAARLKPSSGSRDAIHDEHHGQDKSSQPWATNLQDDQKINSITRSSARGVFGNEWQVQTVQTTKLKFDRVAVSGKMKDILEKLKPICDMVSTVVTLEVLASRGITKTTLERPKPSKDS